MRWVRWVCNSISIKVCRKRTNRLHQKQEQQSNKDKETDDGVDDDIKTHINLFYDFMSI